MAYVYRHIRKDKDQVFYIGIGTDDKGKYTRAHSKNRNRYWKRIVDKTDYEIEILFDDITKEDAVNKEIEFISIYGRHDLGLGSLCNLTDGGEGATNMSEEGRERLREIRRNAVMSQKQKDRYSEMFKGSGNPNSSKIICGKTLKVFGSIQETAEFFKVNKHTLRNNLNGKNCNKYCLFYYKDYLEKGIEFLEEERLLKIKQVKEKLQYKRKNRIVSEETRKKLSISGKGKVLSEEHKLKLININKGSKNHISKKVVNKETKEVFDTITEAAESIGKYRIWLSSKLNGKHKNKTNFIFYDEYIKKEGN
jgi:hypothetical protein